VTLDREQRDLIAGIAADDRQGIRGRLRTLIIAFDIITATLWILLPDSHWSSNSYKPARALLGFLPDRWQFPWYGAMLLILTALIVAAGHTGRRVLYYYASGLIVSYWWFWTVLFAWAALTDSRAGALAPGFAALVACLHALLASTSRT
jgi:hypothetical protein